MVDLDRLERALIRTALERRSVTYGQLLTLFEWKVTRITVAALCRDLGRMEERRVGQGWPDLACLVVRKSDSLPGEGYFDALRREGTYAGPSTGPGAEAFLKARQERAFRWARQEGRALLPSGEEEEGQVSGTCPGASGISDRPSCRRPRAAGRPW
jgi:hypothetical protein